MQLIARFRHYPRLIALVIGVGLSFLLALVPSLPGAAISPAEVPNPRQIDGTWVTDMADMLSPDSENKLNQMISALEATSGTELAVVTVPDTQPSSSPKAFATELFNAWGIGKEGVDNGVLFLVSQGDRRTEIETGYGVEGILSDAQVGKIIDSRVTPQFRSGDFDAGILAGTEAIVAVLNGKNPSLSTSLLSRTGGLADWTDWIFSGFWIAAVAAAISVMALLKQLTKGSAAAIRMNPTGESVALQTGTIPLLLSPARIALFLLTRESTAAAKSPLRKDSQPTDQSGDQSVQDSRLVTLRRSQQLIDSGSKLLVLCFILVSISTLFIKEKVFLAPLLAWVWLGYELWLSVKKEQANKLTNTRLRSLAGQNLFWVVSVSFGFALLCTLSAPPVENTAAWIMMAAVTSVYGAGAGVLRLLRSLPAEPSVVCQSCERPLQLLSDSQLKPYLSQPAQVEIQLQTKFYEGWRCTHCSPNADQNSSNIHLWSQLLGKRGFVDCPTCEALTVAVENVTLEAATTRSSGWAKTIGQCHCCSHRSEHEYVIPRISSSSSSSSSYGSDTSSSSSRSSSSSGSSFGGGSSGGGGAGGSW